MDNRLFSVNIDADQVKAQYEYEQKASETKKTQFDQKNYLNARLGRDENTKTLTIRLLPFSPEGGAPFKKVYMHTLRVNKDLSPSGWKTFVCPTHNKRDGENMGDRCPFCATSAKARELRFNSLDEATRKKYSDIEFMNRAKEMWIVRCIERGHEEDGVKFWLFNSSKKKDGVYDKIMNIFELRAQSAKRKGNDYSIFDLNNGLDLIVTLSRTSDNKTSIQILDDGVPSKLTDNFELGMKWINDPKKWYDVYTVKPYEYMEIVAMGGVPYFDKEQNKFVDKSEANKIREEAERQRIEESLAKPTIDYSAIANPTADPTQIFDGTKVGDLGAADAKPMAQQQDMFPPMMDSSVPQNEDDDLPF